MKLRYLFAALCLCLLLVSPAAAAGGSGTAADPYIIETAAELQSMQNDLSAHYRLANDIDLSGVTWTPIGSASSPFGGSLDGNGKTIKNFHLSSSSSSFGFFGAIYSNAIVKDITFQDCSVTVPNNVGGIVIGVISTSTSSSVLISNVDCVNCHIESESANVGFIVGYQRDTATITDCNIKNSIILSSNGYVGGICGSLFNDFTANINNCIVENCIFSGSTRLGSLIGQNGYGASTYISNCQAVNCVIEGTTSFCGGLVGYSTDTGTIISITDSSVNDCTIFNSGTYSGGIIGRVNPQTDGATITNCIVNDCSILSNTQVGGVCSDSSSASIVSITGCTIQNTNIYAGSNILPIGPSGSYDSTSTATGITNVAGRYIYASGLTPTVTGATAAYTLEGRQGSTTVEATQGTAQSWAWTFGDETTSTTAADTSHTYTEPGTYQTSLKLTNYLDSTGVTINTGDYYIQPIAPVASISANIAQLGDTVSLGAAGILWSGIQWQYTTDGTTWQDISGATTATYDWTPEAGVYTIRAKVTSTATGYTAYSNTVSLGVYAPPTITGLSVSPEIGQYTQTITLAAEVADTGIDETTYQWQQSPEGQNTWTDIAGATTATWIGTLTFTGATDFRLLATGTGGTTTSSTITYYIAAPGEIQSLSASPNVVSLPGSTTLSATGSNVLEWRWQEYTSGAWVTIGYGATLAESLTDAGTYTYRVIATGADGATITSESLEVLAGFAPTVEITSPADGTHYDSGERIPVTATVTGTDAEWQWNFGSDNVQTGGNGLESWVEYGIDGSYTISIRAESIFGTAQDSLTIISGRLSRPIATTPTTELEADGIYEVTDALTPGQNGMPDLWGFIQTLSKPFTDIIGAWFYLVLFAVPYFIIWIRQKNIIIPSILGVMFGAWVLVMLPAAALPAAIGILALAITGGLYGLYVKINR